jgi:hypothetical protein
MYLKYILINGYNTLLSLTSRVVVKPAARIPGNLIPIMTSNTEPSGEAFGTGGAWTEKYYPFWKAFDSIYGISAMNHGWRDKEFVGNSYLGYRFATAKTVTSYAISPYWYVGPFLFYNYSPKSWVFEGSNNGVDYITLDVREDYTLWDYETIAEFPVSNTTAYTYYRVRINKTIANYGEAAICQLQLVGY